MIGAGGGEASSSGWWRGVEREGVEERGLMRAPDCDLDVIPQEAPSTLEDRFSVFGSRAQYQRQQQQQHAG